MPRKLLVSQTSSGGSCGGNRTYTRQDLGCGGEHICTPQKLVSSQQVRALSGEVGYFEVLYRGTSRIRKRLLLRPYSRTIHRALWWSLGGGAFSCE